ncbi:MAG: hypothetical protein II774_11450, partial [Lachnospiraceae bacterium]|nr:hypothetical protein [Lachnospiraceae bacterium]
IDLPAEEVRLIRKHFKNVKTQAERQKRGTHSQSQHFEKNENPHIYENDGEHHLFVTRPPGTAGLYIDQFPEEIINDNKPQKNEYKKAGSRGIKEDAPRKQENVSVFRGDQAV